MNLAKPLEVFVDSISRGKVLHPAAVVKPASRGYKGFVDVDRFPKRNPYQCVDFFDYWILTLGGPNCVGNAIDYAGKTYGRWFKWIKKDPLPGDGVVFDVGPVGHIAIVRKVVSPGMIETWSQNDAEGAGISVKRYTTRNVVGYLRPRGSTKPVHALYRQAVCSPAERVATNGLCCGDTGRLPLPRQAVARRSSAPVHQLGNSRQDRRVH